MIEFLQKLFIGHSHKWEQYNIVNVADWDGSDTAIGYIIVLRCEVCGALKNHKIKWG